jgi:hypothetical protein
MNDEGGIALTNSESMGGEIDNFPTQDLDWAGGEALSPSASITCPTGARPLSNEPCSIPSVSICRNSDIREVIASSPYLRPLQV